MLPRLWVYVFLAGTLTMAFGQREIADRVVPEKSAVAAAGKTSDAPSLSDTEKWIKNTLRDNTGNALCDYQSEFSNNEFECHYQRYVLDFDGCKVTLYTLYSHRIQKLNHSTDELSLDEGEDKKDNTTMEFDLNDIDPTSIRAEQPYGTSGPQDQKTNPTRNFPQVDVCLSTTNDEDKILLSYPFSPSFKDGHRPYKIHEACGFMNHFITAKPEYAPRFVKAVRHSVELCRGKASAF